MSDIITDPTLSMVTEPVILDRTGRMIADRLKSVATALWAEKAPIIERKDVNFYDFDGERVYSYSKVEFLNLTEMPANPAHEGLTPQGWNWSLADAKAYVQKYGVLDIGQMYITDDGKTRLYIEIDYTANLTAHISFYQSAANGTTIDWGDGNTEVAEAKGNNAKSHTYTEKGHYIITLDVADGCTIRLGVNNKSAVTVVAAGGLQNVLFYQGPIGRIVGKDALVAIEIGAGVTEIGAAACHFATRLKYVTIPQTVATIWSLAFWACKSLKAITYPAGLTKLDNMLNGYNYQLEVASIPASVRTLGNTIFKTCSQLNRLCIPEGVTALGSWMCHGLYNAKEIIIPDTVVGAIPNNSFGHCYEISEINIPVGIVSIGNFAFSNCYSLRKCELPEGVTKIGNNVFTSCFAFPDFIIPSTVTEIGKMAFMYADGIGSFHVRATTPPTLEATAFSYVNQSATIYVPYSEDHSILEAYKAATGWCSRADTIVEEGGGA